MLEGTLSDYIITHQVDGVMWKAEKLLANLDNPIIKNDRITEIANTIALLQKPVAREAYAKKIGKLYDVSWPTFKKVLDDILAIHKKQSDIKTTVRKNKVSKLEGDPKVWPFFVEKVKVDKKSGEETFNGIEVNKNKFIELLSSFGYTRYEPSMSSEQTIAKTAIDNYQFVRMEENIIRSVSREQIIDHIVDFIKHDYDFAGANCEFVDQELLLNKFYDGLTKYFSKDLFARVRTTEPIIINRDAQHQSFTYYKNGYLVTDKDGWTLKDYDQMNGSVWATQMKDFELKQVIKLDGDTGIEVMGMFADFCWKVAAENEQRFIDLCCITGYVCHDYYQYKLKAINITDSSLSDASEGRTGKTLWAKMLSYVKALCEINGKDFDAANVRKYEKADLGTQIIHLNDLKTRGQKKFDFEDVFNDITEGYEVRKLYEAPFRHQSKFIFSSNKTLNIVGASQRDRIVEYEWSSFFGEHLSPEQHYGKWFGRDWDDQEWTRFHNFMAFCARCYHTHGLRTPEAINLAERKLMNHTAQEFIDFMSDVKEHIIANGVPFEHYRISGLGFETGCKEFLAYQFDKKQLFTHFIAKNEDFKSWLTAKRFGDWLVQYAQLRLSIKHPKQWRSNGNGYIQFIEQ